MEKSFDRLADGIDICFEKIDVPTVQHAAESANLLFYLYYTIAVSNRHILTMIVYLG